MPAQNFTACAALSNKFLIEAGRIGPDSYKRGREVEPYWLGLVPQREWHDNMGISVNNTIYNRSGLTVPPNWSNITISDPSNPSSCIPPLTVVSNAITQTSYQRQWLALESDPLCLMDIVVDNEPDRAVQMFVDNLMQNATYVRKERVRSEYERVSAHKIVVAPGMPEDSTNFPLVQPTSPVTAGVLRQIYPRIQRDAINTSGVTKVATGERGDEKFIFISGAETIENIIKGDEEIRNDFRYSARVNELLGSFAGPQIAYGGFIMVQDSFPPRYNWNGDFVRVPEYAASVYGAATIGTALETNPAWNNAQFETSYVFHPDVMCSRVPNPKQTFGKVKFTELNYSLQFEWLNYRDRNCNPDGIIGWFRGIGIHATEPIHTILGYAIMGLRCNVALDLVPCASGSGYVSSGFNSSGQYGGGQSALQ